MIGDTCAEDGCLSPAGYRGALCGMHADVERFWLKVDKSNGEHNCWLWTGETNSMGYGRLAEWRSGRRKRTMAHRLALSWHLKQDISRTDVVMHRCDTPRCVNPHHLEIGTQADNLRDMRDKGRGSAPPTFSGFRARQSKLTDDDVRMILASSESNAELARQLGVSAPTVRRARLGSTWSHVDADRDGGQAA